MTSSKNKTRYDVRLLSNGQLQFSLGSKKNIPFSEIRQRFTLTSKFVCDLYVSFRHDTFRKHAMRRCWSFIILPCRSSSDRVEICVLTKAQNKFWHGRDPIKATPRSKDALKLSCLGPECKSRACQFYAFGMCRRATCSFEHVRGGRHFREVIGDVAWTDFQGELDRYTCLQELLCHPSSRTPRCRICVRTPADEIVANNQALVTRSTMSLNDLGIFVQRCLDDRRANEPNYRSRGFAKFLWSSDADQDDGEYEVTKGHGAV